MRKLTVTAAVLGLAALGLAVPTTAAQAAGNTVAGPGCDSKWGPRDGKVYAWDGRDCSGTLLPVPPGGDWGPDAGDRASSVMNRGYVGSLGVAQFLDNATGPAATPVSCRARCMPRTWRTAGSATALRWTTTSVHTGGSTSAPVRSS